MFDTLLVSIQELTKIQDPVWKHRKDNNDTTTDPGFDFKAWLDKYTVFADENVPAWLSAVKETFGKADTKYACVG